MKTEQLISLVKFNWHFPISLIKKSYERDMYHKGYIVGARQFSWWKPHVRLNNVNDLIMLHWFHPLMHSSPRPFVSVSLFSWQICCVAWQWKAIKAKPFGCYASLRSLDNLSPPCKPVLVLFWKKLFFMQFKSMPSASLNFLSRNSLAQLWLAQVAQFWLAFKIFIYSLYPKPQYSFHCNKYNRLS